QDKFASTGENSGACPGSKIPIEPAGTSCQTCLLQCNSSGSETTNCASSGSVSVSPSTVCNMVGPDAWYKVGAEKSWASGLTQRSTINLVPSEAHMVARKGSVILCSARARSTRSTIRVMPSTGFLERPYVKAK